MEQTQTTEQKKPTLEMSLDGMKKIEDQLGQWMLLEEHYTQHSLDRRHQLDLARQLYKDIKAEITAAYRTCPSYSSV